MTNWDRAKRVNQDFMTEYVRCVELGMEETEVGIAAFRAECGGVDAWCKEDRIEWKFFSIDAMLEHLNTDHPDLVSTILDEHSPAWVAAADRARAAADEMQALLRAQITGSWQ